MSQPLSTDDVQVLTTALEAVATAVRRHGVTVSFTVTASDVPTSTSDDDDELDGYAHA